MTERTFPPASDIVVVSEPPSDGNERRTAGTAFAAVAEALEVRRNATRGFGLGAVVAAAALTFFVLVPGTSRPVALFVGLGIVLGVSFGLLATVALVSWRAYLLAGRL